MKFLDDNLIAGVLIGITVGLHYGASLANFMPLFLVGSIIVLLRYVRGR